MELEEREREMIVPLDLLFSLHLVVVVLVARQRERLPTRLRGSSINFGGCSVPLNGPGQRGIGGGLWCDDQSSSTTIHDTVQRNDKVSNANAPASKLGSNLSPKEIQHIQLLERQPLQGKRTYQSSSAD